MKILKEEEEYD